MALRYLLDEHLRGPLWNVIGRHNSLGHDTIDVVRVGDPPDLNFGVDDRVILEWCAREARILVTEDRSTMPMHLADHLLHGGHSPGVFAVRPGVSFREVLEILVLA